MPPRGEAISRRGRCREQNSQGNIDGLKGAGPATAPCISRPRGVREPSVLADTEPSTSHLVRWDDHHRSPRVKSQRSWSSVGLYASLAANPQATT